VAELFAHGFVKICGVTTEADAAMVVESGASALGIILAPSSRRVDTDQGRRIADAVRGTIITTVIVREMSDEAILRGVDEIEPDVVQVHGPLSVELRTALSKRELRIVKALSINSEEFAAYADQDVDAVLIDGPTPGSGVVHSFHGLTTRRFRVPVIAAGGLTPDNVRDIIVATKSQGVDTSSGVESSPGVKNPTLVKRFVEAARGAYEQQGAP
jgi:phosphoribosylanthranilate isomerase